jgi:hypothetical protein
MPFIQGSMGMSCLGWKQWVLTSNLPSTQGFGRNIATATGTAATGTQPAATMVVCHGTTSGKFAMPGVHSSRLI